MTGGATGQTAVVFGGTGALGSAVAARLLADGWRVVAADAAAPRADRALADVEYEQVDALDEASVAGFFAGPGLAAVAVANTIGGYAAGQSVAELDVEVLRSQLDVNLVSATLVTKHAIRALSQRPGGRIVHTSSRVAMQDGRDAFAYSASKLGILRLVEAAAAETRASGITVNCVMPSVIDTPANRAAMPDAPHERWPKAEQIAGVFSFLVSADAELVSGAAIPVYGQG